MTLKELLSEYGLPQNVEINSVESMERLNPLGFISFYMVVLFDFTSPSGKDRQLTACMDVGDFILLKKLLNE